MIQPQTYLEVADNSGARKLMCIRVLNRQYGNIGDVILAVVKEALPNMPVKKNLMLFVLLLYVQHTRYNVKMGCQSVLMIMLP